jgi:hypothetical protein
MYQVLERLGIGIVAVPTALMCAPICHADPDVVGMTYSDAKGVFSQANLTPVVATKTGDRVSLNDCYVVGTSQAKFNDDSGVQKDNVIQVHLSCYPKAATALNPGYSAGNTAPDAEAVRATSERKSMEWKQTSDGQRWCARAHEQHPEWGVIEGCPPIEPQ